MINELHNLAKVLESNRIPTDEWHREYKVLPKVTSKSPCIRIWLDSDGSISALEALDPERTSVLRKYGNNQNSFPAFNISPLYRLTDPECIVKLEGIENGKSKPDIETIKSWCKEDNWIKGTPKKVQRSLEVYPKKLLDAIGTQAQTDDNILTELISLCEKLCTNIEGGFRTSLENYIFAALQKEDEVGAALALLFHKGSSELDHSKDVGSNICVILDVKNWKRYGYPVASEHTTVELNQMLLANSTKNKIPADTSQLDAFGSPFKNPSEPMPSVKLSGFEVTLRSMFRGQPCQYRYGQIEDRSYPITVANRASIKKALEWIAAPSRRQITWVKIDKNELVFVYPSKLPEASPKFASVFGDPATPSKRSESRFENIAEAFIKHNPALKHSGIVLKNYLEQNRTISPQLTTQSIQDELRLYGLNKIHQNLLEYEHLQNFPQLEHDFKVINSDTRLVIVDADIAERLCAGEVKWQELQKTSVQIGKYKLDKLKIPQIANEIYHWNLEYDNFLGYMAGIIKRKGTADKH